MCHDNKSDAMAQRRVAARREAGVLQQLDVPRRMTVKKQTSPMRVHGTPLDGRDAIRELSQSRARKSASIGRRSVPAKSPKQNSSEIPFLEVDFQNCGESNAALNKSAPTLVAEERKSNAQDGLVAKESFQKETEASKKQDDNKGRIINSDDAHHDDITQSGVDGVCENGDMSVIKHEKEDDILQVAPENSAKAAEDADAIAEMIASRDPNHPPPRYIEGIAIGVGLGMEEAKHRWQL